MVEPSSGDAGPLSILHVAVPARVGGLESVVRGLAIGHRRRGQRVGVVVVMELSGSEPPLVAELRSEGVDVRVVDVPPRSYLRERRAVDRAIEAFDPDVLHTHGYRSDILDAGLARKHGLGLVTTVHGSSRMGGLSTIFEWIQTHLFRRFDAVVAVSDALRRELVEKGIPEERIHVIRNGLYPEVEFLDRREARERLDVPLDALVVGWLGRLIPAKGPDILVEALSRMERSDVTASIIGDGPMLDPLVERASALGLGERIRFHGEIKDGARFLRAFDLFALSSRTEGTPVVLLEAMAARIPIVCTTVGGVPEVIGPEAAWHVPEADPDSFAAALERACGSREALESQVESAGRLLEERYSGEAWLPQYEEVYQKVRSG